MGWATANLLYASVPPRLPIPPCPASHPLQSNVYEIITELSEYVIDVDADIARKAVRALGAIGIKIPAAVDNVVEQVSQYEDAHCVIKKQIGCAVITALTACA